jgi:hypothetical protein
VLPPRKPRHLVGRNVVTEFIAAGGAPEARERLLRRLRTEGRWDPQIPNFRATAAVTEKICNFARTILDPYVQKGQPWTRMRTFGRNPYETPPKKRIARKISCSPCGPARHRFQ